MKKLLFIRHAKSSWESATLRDFDRPLNDRGHKDAPAMAARLINQKIKIDLFISSPALRALTTAKYFHSAFKASEKQLILVPELYHPEVAAFYQIIQNLHDDIHCAAMFSHNPGITYMVGGLGVASIDNMPTCGVFGVQANIKNWSEFREAPKNFWLFDYPKNA